MRVAWFQRLRKPLFMLYVKNVVTRVVTLNSVFSLTAQHRFLEVSASRTGGCRIDIPQHHSKTVDSWSAFFCEHLIRVFEHINKCPKMCCVLDGEARVTDSFSCVLAPATRNPSPRRDRNTGVTW